MQIRVLYVDDEPDLREIAVMSLELDQEFEVRECSNGVDALAFASEWQPHIVLLDVMMTPIDGPETARRLRAEPQTEDIPFVFITARARSGDIEDLMNAGACGVISKPFDPLTLAQAVRSLIDDCDDRGQPSDR